MLQVPNKLDPRGFFCRKGNHPNTKNFRKKQQQQRKKKNTTECVLYISVQTEEQAKDKTKIIQL